MKKLKLTLTILSILAGLGLTGCGHEIATSTENASQPTAPLATNAPIGVSDDTASWDNPFTKEEDVPRHEDGRALVTLSGLHVDTAMEEAVVAFNKSNPDYYVEILKKESGQTFSDYHERERIELSTGKGPDIFCNTLMSSFTTYIEKGIMEDLMPYIERDLNPDDYLASSLYAYEQNGKVYALEASFNITTQVGAKDILGERTSWSFAEMQALMKENPQITLYEDTNMEPGEFLRVYLAKGAASYTDYDTLKEVIAFDKAYNGHLPDDVMEMPGENVMVATVTINDALDLADFEALYAKELNVIGFVNEKGYGNVHESFGWSINTASRQKEGAWAFLCYLLSEEYQRTYVTAFSPLKSVFEEQLNYYAQPVTETIFIEELGQEVTITRKHTLRLATSAQYGSSVEIECVTAEQLQKVWDMVENSHVTSFDWDETAGNIIHEEASSYFNDKSSLDAVISAIENRMNIYLSETQ